MGFFGLKVAHTRDANHTSSTHHS